MRKRSIFWGVESIVDSNELLPNEHVDTCKILFFAITCVEQIILFAMKRSTASWVLQKKSTATTESDSESESQTASNCPSVTDETFEQRDNTQLQWRRSFSFYTAIALILRRRLSNRRVSLPPEIRSPASFKALQSLKKAESFVIFLIFLLWESLRTRRRGTSRFEV